MGDSERELLLLMLNHFSSYNLIRDFKNQMTPLLHVLLCPLQSLGNSQREYEKHVLLYSIRNQLRFRNNLGETARFSTQTAEHTPVGSAAV